MPRCEMPFDTTNRNRWWLRLAPTENALSVAIVVLGSLFLLACEGETKSAAPDSNLAQAKPTSQETGALRMQTAVPPEPTADEQTEPEGRLDDTDADEQLQGMADPEDSRTDGDLNGSSGDLPFNKPSDVVFLNGDLYIADTVNDMVRKISLSTGHITTVANIERPVGMAGLGNHLFVGVRSKIVRIDTQSGETTEFAGSESPGKNDGVGSDAKFDHVISMVVAGGDMYVGDQSGLLRKIELATRKVTSIDVGLQRAADAPKGAPAFVPGGMVEVSGHLYLVDRGSHRILKINPVAGTSEVVAGGGPGLADGPGAAAKFLFPTGIASDGRSLFVADTLNHRIRKLDVLAGNVTTIAGGGGGGYHSVGSADGLATAAAFNGPDRITALGCCLYVSDKENNRIRVIDINSGSVSTLASNRGAAISTSKIASTLQTKAEHGDAASQYQLGNLYADEAKKLIDCGDMPCGDDDPRQTHKLELLSKEKSEIALSWYLKAAKQGHADAQFQVGKLSSSGVTQNGKREDPFTWYMAAANQGLAIAQDAVGSSFFWGYWVSPNTKPNYLEAFNWFLKAANQGLDSSQHAVGRAYHTGQGVEKNLSEARNWYLKAAENGNHPAQHSLGCLLAEGSGSELITAVKWLEIVDLTNRNDEYDYSCRVKAESRMSPEQIDEAKKLAREIVGSKGLSVTN